MTESPEEDVLTPLPPPPATRGGGCRACGTLHAVTPEERARARAASVRGSRRFLGLTQERGRAHRWGR